jgi:cytochrome c biogenesis protein ResB
MKTPILTSPGASPAEKPGWVRRIIRGLKSIRFAIILMAIIAAACLVGTLVVQEPYVPEKAIARYGRTLGLLVGLLGLNQLYGTWWFLSLLGLLALSVAACTFSGARFSLRRICTLVAHASILLIVAGAILRGVAGVDGMVKIEKGETVKSFYVEGADPNAAVEVPLGFQLRLDDFVIRYYNDARDWLAVQLDETGGVRSIPRETGKVIALRPDGTSVEVLRYLPDFKLRDHEAYSASDEPRNPAVEVRFTGPAGESTQWLFAKFPDLEGHGSAPKGVQIKYIWSPPSIKAFESHVTILDESGKELRSAVILVNSPLKAGRYTFYQTSYDLETLSSTLEVTHDPGVPLVFAGFILLPIGIALAFYLRPLLNRKGRSDV